MHRLWSTGVATGELSYYTPLQNLFNELGRKLKPKVFCLSNPKDTGAGHPDFYFFTANQLPKARSLREPIPDAPPERGVVEAKRATADVRKRIETKQVSDYLRHYGLILVTNYRDFALVGQGPQGEKVLLERYQLASSEEAFRQLTAHPAKIAKEQNTRFVEFLTRVLLHRAPLAQPKDVAWFLASYARDALARIEEAGDLPALAAVRTALEQALGLRFEGEKGEHFFRSTLVQTLFYGVFSAWVLWSRQQAPGSRQQFDWHAAAWSADGADAVRRRGDAGTAGTARPRRGARLGGGGSQPCGSSGVLREVRGGRGGAVFLRAVPRSLRSRTEKATRRVVYAAGDRQIHGGAHRRRPA
jgi:hypothetical protein